MAVGLVTATNAIWKKWCVFSKHTDGSYYFGSDALHCAGCLVLWHKSFQRPFHAAWEDQGYVDREVWRKAGANGFLCMGMPEEYGGSGVNGVFR